ncbi:putative uridylyltransferase [Jeotgalicoccus coquinae]|uniref:Uridylyltransferase n=1 Tax=Jeotgalicoccus coquinae TaxID=709509 RepID=A0A6V7R3J6_9STAP|nr:UTP--glucose-1-phosphate uridylyltransferase [Jeotgalicoccus coquinae]MBB6423342.1 putative uridylyltransferase [Jeotgalicoccus coquinae]GGE19110.1 putative uridylyltransferase [Jeotgalicoccus coquinae]CAD2071910.1 putative uridylyltransferase [Jeotgalicoccus coquinae]
MIEKWIPQYSKLEETKQNEVREQFDALDIKTVERVYDKTYVNQTEVDLSSVEEVPYVLKSELDLDAVSEAADKAVRDGEVAVVLMAGGQGTRLEHPGPKGTFSFDGVSLFELQARQILKYKNEAGELKVHWYIMTSDINHEETLLFFKEHGFFNVPEENIHFFKQEHFPPLTKDGELMLTAEQNIMLTPNGNGGIFSSLKNSGMLNEMEANGVQHVFMNNVDNVVVKVLDPALVGLHVTENNDITSKSITPKSGESVGRLAIMNGDKGVVEYTELPAGSEDKFTNANIGIHMYSTNFLNKAADGEMPYHLALKKLEHLDGELSVVKEEVLKFEKFYFDAFKYADKHNTLQVDRKGEFSPLKNKAGNDSIETAAKDLTEEGLI